MQDTSSSQQHLVSSDKQKSLNVIKLVNKGCNLTHYQLLLQLMSSLRETKYIEKQNLTMPVPQTQLLQAYSIFIQVDRG